MQRRMVGLFGALGAACLAAGLWLWPSAPEPAAVAGAIAVPSGQIVTLQDVVANVPGPNGLTTRFRFLAPAIARSTGTVPLDLALADMEALCNSYALPRISDFGPVPRQVVISLSDVPVPFGQTAPEATQYFEAYTIEGQSCIWDVF